MAKKNSDKKGRVQPGIDKETKESMEYIKENSPIFRDYDEFSKFDNADLFRLGVAITVKNHETIKLEPHPSSVGANSGGQTWSRSSLDTDPSLTKMVEFLIDEKDREEIWSYIERAAKTGIKYLHKQVKLEKDLSEIFN